MWLEKENPQDPYNRLGNVTSAANAGKDITVGTGGAAAQPGGTQANPSTLNPVQSQQPKQEFATVQDYLKGNQAQGEQLGQKVVGSLGESLAKEKSTIGQSAQAAQSDITSGTPIYNAGLVTSALKDPAKVANTPDQLESFLKQWNASYSGPSSFESSSEYAPAIAAASEAQTKGAEATTTGGQQQLLQEQFGVYGQGNKALDQAVLQNSSQYGNLLNKGKEFGNIQDYLAQQTGVVNTAAQKGRETAEATKQQTQQAFANKPQEFQKYINDLVASKRGIATSQETALKDALASGNSAKISSALTTAGFSAAEQQAIMADLKVLNTQYGVNPNLSSYATFNPDVAITPATAASTADYARAAALQKLTGVEYGGILNPADIAQAGKAATIAPLVKAGVQSKDIQTYLKGQVKQQDTELMDKSTFQDAATKLGMSDFTKNLSDVAAGKRFAQAVIDAATRTNTKAGFGKAGIGSETNPLGKLVINVSQYLTTLANQMGGRSDIPQLAGLKVANDILRQYFGTSNHNTYS